MSPLFLRMLPLLAALTAVQAASISSPPLLDRSSRMARRHEQQVFASSWSSSHSSVNTHASSHGVSAQSFDSYLDSQPSWVSCTGEQATNLTNTQAQTYSDAARASKAVVKQTYTLDSAGGNCFPFINMAANGSSVGGQNGTAVMPSSPPANLTGWWCDPDTEYAFLGFSYETSACQGPQQMLREFMDIKQTFNGRYVRIYGTCDTPGYWDQIINTAWQVGLGVHALVWFGFNGDLSYIGRRDQLASSLMNNPYAPYVVRLVQFGSEPLFDWVLPVQELTSEIVRFQQILSPASIAIDVTISELAYGYQEQKDEGSYFLFNIIDSINQHQLPYFAGDASTGANAWHDVSNDLNFMVKNGQGKKIVWDENGWPSTHYDGVEPNSPNAVSDVPNEQAYFQLLQNKCSYLKTVAGGGVGWFFHIYNDNQEPGYGYYDVNNKPKFSPFQPALFC